MKDEQLSLFEEYSTTVDKSEQAQLLEKSSSALPESATEEWRQLYTSIGQYAKKLKPNE